MKRTQKRLAALATIPLCGGLAAQTSSNPPTAEPQQVLEEVTVTATPLDRLEHSVDRAPGNIQQAGSEEIERARNASLAQFLNERMGSVFINEAQANPLQPDVQYRGFLASPLLGQPQGMAVYQDGVRINDPFGDIVNWALVPEAAISSIELVSGSNPVFGLNSLGGALSIHTKNGFTNPGTYAQIMGGSFGRAVAQIQSGASFEDRASYFGSARYFKEEGWRQFSPSDALHLFGNLGWQSDASSMALGATWIATDLIGNGPAPVELLALERDAIYTRPDRTRNDLAFVTLNVAHQPSLDAKLAGVIWFRDSDIGTLNGDESEFEECQNASGFLCDDTEEIALAPDGSPITFSEAVDGATLNRGSTDQKTYGVSGQLNIMRALAGRSNRLTIGASLDRSSVQFTSSTELGRLDETRAAVSSGILLADAFVNLDSRLESASAFFTNTLALRSDLDLIVAARYNDARIALRDRIGTELSGTHDFARFNGAAGLTYRPHENLRFYANYGASNRAPSPVELTCADEDDPCALPNSFLSDPPLKQVISNTFEAGARGSWRGLRWHAGVFRTTNENEIVFISAGALTNRGFFDNIGDTQRRGVEVNLEGTLFDERVRWFAQYMALRAEFRESFRVLSPNHPAAIASEIPVPRGSRIPGVPEHLLKVGAAIKLTPRFALDVDVQHRSNQFMRGDEGNLLRPLAAFTLVNASGEWQLNRKLMFFMRLENVLEENYASFGLIGAPGEVLGEGFEDGRFVSPGAPVSGWLGVKWTL